ncbi:hypothetical protein D3C87_1356250 [compost metagenome]
MFEGKAGGGDYSCSDPIRKTAIDDDAGKIDDGGCSDNGLRKGRGRFSDPAFQRLAEIDPLVRREPQGTRIDAAFAQHVFQNEDGGDFQKLDRVAVLPLNWQGADCTGGARLSGKQCGI